MKLSAGMKVLFHGDSITDAGRDREDKYSLAGYVRMISGPLAAMGIETFNRAVSGERTGEMLSHFARDCEEVRPDLVSILIGINDTWRRYDSNAPTTVEDFERNYRAILETAKRYAGQIVILEPFLLPVDPEKSSLPRETNPDKSHFREDLNPKIDVVRKLAREYATDFLPLDGLFAEAVLHIPAELFSLDGVHPTEAGQRFIAAQWLNRAEQC